MNDDDMVWGAEAIAKKIGRPVIPTQKMLAKGALVGAKKIGGRWCLCYSVFMAQFKEQEDAGH